MKRLVQKPSHTKEFPGRFITLFRPKLRAYLRSFVMCQCQSICTLTLISHFNETSPKRSFSIHQPFLGKKSPFSSWKRIPNVGICTYDLALVFELKRYLFYLSTPVLQTCTYRCWTLSCCSVTVEGTTCLSFYLIVKMVESLKRSWKKVQWYINFDKRLQVDSD